MEYKVNISLINHSDYIFPLALVVILGLMIIPMPTFLMDTMLALNISISFLTLLLAAEDVMRKKRALKSVFSHFAIRSDIGTQKINAPNYGIFLMAEKIRVNIFAFSRSAIGQNLMCGII